MADGRLLMATEYDELPYDSQSIPHTAPEQLAVVSLLHGGPVPPVRGARVLEIGCGDGANLLALAAHRPDSKFVGVDTSEVHIRSARASAKRLEIRNVRWIAGDAATADLGGPFDVVLLHGVLSWVDDASRRGLLARCRKELADGGLVYAGYNTHPGWKVRGLVREVLRRFAAPGPIRDRVARARELASFVRERIGSVDHPFAALMVREFGRVIDGGESYVAHEYLAAHNEAFWLRDFAALAGEHGLHYVAEAGFHSPEVRVPLSVREPVVERGLAGLEREELVDVLWYRQHRTSILAAAPPGAPGPMDGLTAAAGLRRNGRTVTGVGGFSLEVPAADADALERLAERWPAGIPFASLGLSPSLALDLYAAGQLDLRLREPAAWTPVGPKPRALPITRFEAKRHPVITTPGHIRLPLDELDRKIVDRLDGTRTPARIAKDLACDRDRVTRLAALLGAWGLLA